MVQLQVTYSNVHCTFNSLLGGNSELEPPVPIPNTEVKRLSADDSVAIAM